MNTCEALYGEAVRNQNVLNYFNNGGDVNNYGRVLKDVFDFQFDIVTKTAMNVAPEKRSVFQTGDVVNPLVSFGDTRRAGVPVTIVAIHVRSEVFQFPSQPSATPSLTPAPSAVTTAAPATAAEP